MSPSPKVQSARSAYGKITMVHDNNGRRNKQKLSQWVNKKKNFGFVSNGNKIGKKNRLSTKTRKKLQQMGTNSVNCMLDGLRRMQPNVADKNDFTVVKKPKDSVKKNKKSKKKTSKSGSLQSNELVISGWTVNQNTNKKEIEQEASQPNVSFDNNASYRKAVNGSFLESKAAHCKKSSSVSTQHSSFVEGETAFSWIIGPVPTQDFFSKHWEKSPMVIKRGQVDYFKGVFSTADFDQILREQKLEFTKNVDITSYVDGVRETQNPQGRAYAPLVWDRYNSGCSIRLLNPQTFHSHVWRLLATLQEFFNSFCGANVYLTPPGTQGFAPHWDDIEAFVLQLEGKKHWKVYKPRKESEVLANESSPNFTEVDLPDVPLLEVMLEPGDLLYFPRGFIHQASSLPDTHSLHITLSTYQHNSWGDLLKKLLPQAALIAMDEDVEFRRGLPREYLSYMGLVHADKQDSRRDDFANKVGQLVTRMFKFAPIDAAVDQMGKQFIYDSLPPFLKLEEKSVSVYGDGEWWNANECQPVNRVELAPDTQIKLIRGNCLRLIPEDDCTRIFYSVENSREYHEFEPMSLEVTPEEAAAIEVLVVKYPNFMVVEDLPLRTLADKVSLAMALWEKGILLTSAPLECPED